MAGRRWTAEEDELVREHYPEHGPSWAGWSDVLPGRTRANLQVHAYRLGITMEGCARERAWSPAELDAIREHYPEHGSKWPGWADLLDGRTPGAIAARAERIGVHRYGRVYGPWTDRQRKAMLRALAGVSSACGHTVRDCLGEATRLSEAWDLDAD